MKPFVFEKTLKTGDKATLLCELSDGTLPVSFSWFRDGQRFFGDETAKIDTQEDFSTIRFKSISGKDVGNYTCSASNSHGIDSFTARLVVKSEFPCEFRVLKSNSSFPLISSSSILDHKANEC